MSNYELDDDDLNKLIDFGNAMNLNGCHEEYNWYKQGFRAGINAAIQFIEERG